MAGGDRKLREIGVGAGQDLIDRAKITLVRTRMIFGLFAVCMSRRTLISLNDASRGFGKQ
jgi:hypothetical protein